MLGSLAASSCQHVPATHSSGRHRYPAALACRRTVVTRGTPPPQQLQQKLQFEHDGAVSSSLESQWRWFGFGATACNQRDGAKSVGGTDYVSMAAYDIESGEFCTTLINPKLHDPSFRITQKRLQGLSKEEVLSEGLHVLLAFKQLVEFVHSHTPPGQTPVIVAHRGFNLVFRHVEQCLQRAAAAATVNQQSDSAINSSTVGKEHAHSSWLPSWLFHDTVVMATCLYELLPEKSTLHEQLGASLARTRRDLTTFNFDTMRFNEQRSALLDDRDTLSALDAQLLPQRQYSAAPRDQALVAAISTGRLAQLLLTLLQEPPEDEGSGPLQKRGIRRLKWQHYSPWVCTPYPLNPADHPRGRFPRWAKRAGGLAPPTYNWHMYLPCDMMQAGWEVADEYHSKMKSRWDWRWQEDMLTSTFKAVS